MCLEAVGSQTEKYVPLRMHVQNAVLARSRGQSAG